ncbi:MAG: hypothetical protein AUH31_01405 [Armatimonadetes bacterium 13_1_40CM_64_14]|nr:MAG: hypothetical protein AUH31_01405 [Armatimonadetes bacterium 13_1_40CM_64_14]
MTSSDEQMLSRIGFAERWLARARGQWTAGHHARGLLTLVLADAELRHAMETAGARRRTRAHPPTAATGFLLAAVVASALLLIGRWSITPHAVATTPPPPVVSPSFRSGALMDAVVRPAPLVTSAVAVHAVVPGIAARTASSQMAVPPQAQSQAHSASASGPAASLRLPSRSRPSLLDLVLIAERVLRQDPAGSSLP